jgi:hypothetical protein
MFQQAIPKLHNFLARNPHPGLDFYIRELQQHFQEMIRTHLEGYRNQLCKYPRRHIVIKRVLTMIDIL